MVAGAEFVVDAIAGFDDARAAFELLGHFGADAPLPRQHALAVGDDHFEPVFGTAHGLFERRSHFADAVAAHGAQPFDAKRAERLLDADSRRRAGAVSAARGQILLTGGRSIAVLHDHQHAVAIV